MLSRCWHNVGVLSGGFVDIPPKCLQNIVIYGFRKRKDAAIEKWLHPWAGFHKTVSASKSIFLPNTAKNRYGRRQPYRSGFSCLAGKIFAFEVLCSFATWIFSWNKEYFCRNAYCILRKYSEVTREKTGSKPNNVL